MQVRYQAAPRSDTILVLIQPQNHSRFGMGRVRSG
jgi:hypothetical protein